MPLSPEDIEGTHFLVALRGYDKDQVDAFLKQVAAEHRSLLRRVQQVRDRGEGGDPFDKLAQQVETVARAAITAAEKIEAGARSEAAELRRRAEAEAEAVRTAAEMLRSEAAELRTRAEAEAETLRVEGAELRRQLEREIEAVRAEAEAARAEAQAVRAQAEAARVQADAELVEAVGMLQQAELDAASIREEAQRALDQARAAAQAIAPARGPV